MTLTFLARQTSAGKSSSRLRFFESEALGGWLWNALLVSHTDTSTSSPPYAKDSSPLAKRHAHRRFGKSDVDGSFSSCDESISAPLFEQV